MCKARWHPNDANWLRNELAAMRVINHSKGRESLKCVKTDKSLMQFFTMIIRYVLRNAKKDEWKKFKGTKTTKDYRIRDKVKIHPHAGWNEQELNLTTKNNMKGAPDVWLTKCLWQKEDPLPITLGQMWVIFSQGHYDSSPLPFFFS